MAQTESNIGAVGCGISYYSIFRTTTWILWL